MNKQDLFEAIGRCAEQQGTPAYVVGGYVRDEYLREQFGKDYLRPLVTVEKSRVQAALEQDIIDGGEEVIEKRIEKKDDIDVVVEGSGVGFAQALDAELNQSGSLVLFEDFDTARYVFSDIELEFAGARREAYDPNSRKPIVQHATLAEDLSRRDFTVNAMARPINPDGSLGEIIDPYGGMEDAQQQQLKTPLDPIETFSEDPLRMLRAARFAAQLSFGLAEGIADAIHAERKRIAIISAERIQEELFKLLKTNRPSIGFTILFQTKLLDEFFPELVALDGVEDRYGKAHKNNFWHTLHVVDNIATRTADTLLRYAALMHDIGKPGTKAFDDKRGWTFDMHEHLGRKMVRQIGKRLRMSNADIEYVATLVRWHQQPIQLMDDGVTDSAVRRLVVALGDDIDDLLKLCRSDITTGNPKKLARRLKNYDVLEARIIDVIQKDKLRAFQSPVRGEEIMQRMGLKPGPTIGKVKTAIEEAILDGDIPNEYEAALAYFDSIQDTYLSQAADWEKT
jgi:putative nucleotidyltransferase with HDIG domain